MSWGGTDYNICRETETGSGKNPDSRRLKEMKTKKMGRKKTNSQYSKSKKKRE